MVTHHKLLLVASHAGAPLGVLVSPDQQLDQAGNGALLTQSTVVGRAEGQVADETDGGLEWEENQSQPVSKKKTNSVVGKRDELCRCKLEEKPP